MRLSETILFIFLYGLSLSLYGEEVLFVESMDLIDGCKTFYNEVKPSSHKPIRTEKILQRDIKDISSEFQSAKESFYRLEVEASLKKFDNIIKTISNSIITNGSLEEIYDLLGESLMYKILIHISKKEIDAAKGIFSDFYPVISSFSLEGKKFHPSLKSFLTENQSAIKTGLSYDSETSSKLRKGLGFKYPYLFDSLHRVPESIERTNHLLVIAIGNNSMRTIVRNFSRDADPFLNIGKVNEAYVFLVMDRDSIRKGTELQGSEAVYCKEGENLLLLSNGKSLSREEALSRNLKVEIIPANTEGDRKWYSKWWVYMAGGTLTAAILTSVFIMSRGDRSSESFRDKVQVK